MAQYKNPDIYRMLKENYPGHHIQVVHPLPLTGERKK